MQVDAEVITRFVWANYAAQQAAAQVTPGVHLTMDEQTIVITSFMPLSDANHACLLRTTPHDAERLIDDVIARFRWRPVRPTIYLSPACTPPDLAERLLARGFEKQEAEEEWMVFGLVNRELPQAAEDVILKQAAHWRDIWIFSRIFVAAFQMPAAYIPVLTLFTRPSLDIPAFHHYLAVVNGEAVGTASMFYHQDIAVLGSVGMLPTHRGSRAISTLLIKAFQEAWRAGIRWVLLQTDAETKLTRLLRISGFETLFTRTCYVLPRPRRGAGH